MATMSRKKTGSPLIAWDYYVEGRDDWESFKLLTVERSSPVFDCSGEPVSQPLRVGAEVELLDNLSVVVSDRRCAHVSVDGAVGYIPLARLRKTRVKRTAKECEALRALDELVRGQRIRVGPRQIRVSGAREVFGASKADFALIDSRGRDAVYFSHKSRGGPRGFQQYASLTDGSSDIVREFMVDLSGLHEDLTESRLKFKRRVPLTDEGVDLCMKSIYGPEYGSAHSPDHVHYLAQGDPVLHRGRLSFTEVFEPSGSRARLETPGYEPTLFARYSADRRYYADGHPHWGVRVLVGPAALAAHAEEI